MTEKKKPWWDDWYTIRCPECDSKNVEELNIYKYTFSKNLKELKKYKCKECHEIFWE